MKTALLLGLAAWAADRCGAQVCTTQAAMQPADRTALASAASTLAAAIAAGNAAAVHAASAPDLSRDFAGVEGVVASTAPHLAGTTAAVDQVYVLDASAATATADTQFDCTLRGSASSVGFAIPQLPRGRYGFAVVDMQGPTPWRLSFLLQQVAGQWKLAGLYPRAATAGGHDGLWYWREARKQAASKQNLTAWLNYQEARSLLVPAGFVSSTHLEKLDGELQTATPPTVDGLSADAPLVLTSADGSEYRFTSLGVDDAQGVADIAAHLKVSALGDAATARKRNADAMAVLLRAHPELRPAFHGIVLVTDAPGASPYATEAAMADIK